MRLNWALTWAEIKRMSAGPKLDAWVGDLIMNWDHNHIILECEDKFYSYCTVCGYAPRFEKVVPGTCEEYPPYSTDIPTAFQVVEKFKDVEIYKDDNKYTVWINMVGTSSSNELPLAICRAALLDVLEN